MFTVFIIFIKPETVKARGQQWIKKIYKKIFVTARVSSLRRLSGNRGRAFQPAILLRFRTDRLESLPDY